MIAKQHRNLSLKRKILIAIHHRIYPYIRKHHQNYVKKQLLNRKGDCNNCGWCCSYRTCQYLIKKGDKYFCTTYETRDSNNCGNCFKGFPINKTEKWLLGFQKHCGYYWKK